MTRTTLSRIALAAALAIAASAAHAQVAGEYLRAEAGSSSIEASNVSEHSNSWNLRGGWYFTPNIAAEIFYASDFNSRISGVNLKLDGEGAGLAGKWNWSGHAHVGGYLSARGGLASIALSENSGGVTTDYRSSLVPYFGIGGGYDFTPHIGVGLNYERYVWTTSKLNAGIMVAPLALDVEYRF